MKSDDNKGPKNKPSHNVDESVNKDAPKNPRLGFHSSLVSIAEQEESETEVAAEISVPREGSWGWVVVAASFLCIFILDGTFFTFGSLYKDMSEDLQTDESFIACINSVAIALYFMSGPVISALINRFGFRFCIMTGSIIVSFSFFASYFATVYWVLLLLYGIIPGFGGCLIYMSSQLVVGFYFERLRGLAMAMAGLGQSCGVTIMSTVNTHLCLLAGWRTTTLLHSGLFGLLYFVGMVYRPLVSLTVTHGDDDTHAVTYLPSLSTMALSSKSRKSRADSSPNMRRPSTTERVLKAVSNANFPTVADMIEEENDSDEENKEVEPGPSSEPAPVSASMVSIKSRIKESKIQIQASNREERPSKKLKWWQRCCRWEKHAEESRPMYRDDAFYDATLHRLPVYQKSLMSTRRKKTGLEYRMAVSRTVTPDDLREKTGVLTHSVRRPLATMLHTGLLGKCSFLLVCSAGFSAHVGLLVPYIFLPDRNRIEGVAQEHCNLFVSVIGLSNAVGRLIAGVLACKYNPVRMYSYACISAGTASIISNFSFNPYFQYFCCGMFGMSAAHISTMRSLLIVDLYGLDNLTNATGMLLMFQGLGCLLSNPLASVLKINFGYLVSFFVSGSFMIIGGLCVFNVKKVALREEARQREMVAKFGMRRSRSVIIKKRDKNKK